MRTSTDFVPFLLWLALLGCEPSRDKSAPHAERQSPLPIVPTAAGNGNVQLDSICMNGFRLPLRSRRVMVHTALDFRYPSCDPSTKKGQLCADKWTWRQNRKAIYLNCDLDTRACNSGGTLTLMPQADGTVKAEVGTVENAQVTTSSESIVVITWGINIFTVDSDQGKFSWVQNPTFPGRPASRGESSCSPSPSTTKIPLLSGAAFPAATSKGSEVSL